MICLSSLCKKSFNFLQKCYDLWRYKLLWESFRKCKLEEEGTNNFPFERLWTFRTNSQFGNNLSRTIYTLMSDSCKKRNNRRGTNYLTRFSSFWVTRSTSILTGSLKWDERISTPLNIRLEFTCIAISFKSSLYLSKPITLNCAGR